MKIQDFEKDIQAIDPDLSIKPAPTKGLAGIHYKGVFLMSCPDGEIFDEKNEAYSIEIQGRIYPHRSRMEVIDSINGQLLKLKTDSDYADAFFGRGQYSDAALR
jgi:hypothetical protein